MKSIKDLCDIVESVGAKRQILNYSFGGYTERGEYDTVLTNNEDNAEYIVYTIPGDGVLLICDYPNVDVNIWASGSHAQMFVDLANNWIKENRK